MGSFSAGFIKGIVVSLIVAGGISLSFPLNPADPGRKTQVDLTTPAESGFNAGRSDSDPVLPVTDQSVTSETEAPATVTTQTGDDSQNAPVADTASTDRPPVSSGFELPQISSGDDELALNVPQSDSAPQSAPAALGVPMPEIENPVREIPVNRLPVIEQPVTEIAPPAPVSTDTEPALPVTPTPLTATLITATPEPSEQPATTPDVEPVSALLRNKIEFSNPQDKPLMSIILIDAGAESLDRGALVTFSFPVTFAVDVSANDAVQTADIYANNGFEIAALAPRGDKKLEASVNDGDLQAVLAGMLAGFPRAVGLIDEPTAGIQQSPALADQVIETLQQSGHGFLTYDIGLNSTNQKANAAGIAADTVFRVIDSEGENSTVIKRYLDRAVLEAGKNGHVIIVGHTYPNTVTALFSWALSPKSATIALAPLSASLLAK